MYKKRINLKVSPHRITDETYEEMYDHFKLCGYDLYDYQRKGIKFIVDRETDPSFYNSALLCDEPGLGKTIQTVAAMYLNPKRTLLVLPNCVVNQWKALLELIFPESKIYLHHGLKRHKEIVDLEAELVDTQIVLTTYGMMKHLLPNIKWGRIVYDEVHFLRNPKTKRYRVAIDMKSSSYIGLTGTPVNNHIVDIRSVYSVLGFPDAVLDETMSEYYEELNTKYILRRTKPDVMDENPLLQMPDLSVEVHETPFLYDWERKIHLDTRRQLFERYGSTTGGLIPLEWFLRMRQACIHPHLVDIGLGKKWGVTVPIEQNVPSTKFEVIRTMMEAHSDEKTLIFCYFKPEIDMLRHILERSEWSAYQIDGSVSMAERTEAIEAFRADTDKSVMLIQISAGAVGMNLQFASRVYFTSPHYNPSVEIQAIARAHRLGQERPVKVVKVTIVDDGFIEEEILAKQNLKREVMARVLDDKRLLDNAPHYRIKDKIQYNVATDKSN